jgi:hypothetical protein
LFDPTDGVDDSSIGSTFADIGDGVIEGVFLTVNCVTRSTAGTAGSMMEINSAAPSSSTWKLNNPKVISKPLILVEVSPIEHEMGSSIAATGVSMATIGAQSMMVGEYSVPTVGEAVSFDGRQSGINIDGR